METSEEIKSEKKRGWSFYSFIGSIVMHSLIFLIFLFVISRLPQTGSPMGEGSMDSVGIVFSSGSGSGSEANESNTVSKEKPSDTEAAVDLLPSEEIDDQFLTEFLPSKNVIGMRSNSSESKESALASPISGQQTGSGDVSSGGSGNSTGSGSGSGDDGQTVSFSDLKGNGKKFVYVLDRSESMRWSNEWPMRYAIQEAKSSITSLDPKFGALRFQLIYYNHEAHVFEKERLLEVTAQNKTKVLRFLDSIYPEGGTDPLAAIELAIKLSPDVVFFLTDADEEISPMALARIHELAKRNGIRQIHVVEFGKVTAVQKRSFRQMAYENNGQYIFKRID